MAIVSRQTPVIAPKPFPIVIVSRQTPVITKKKKRKVEWYWIYIPCVISLWYFSCVQSRVIFVPNISLKVKICILRSQETHFLKKCMYVWLHAEQKLYLSSTDVGSHVSRQVVPLLEVLTTHLLRGQVLLFTFNGVQLAMQCNAQGSSFYSLLYSLMQCSGVKFFNSLSMVCSAWCNWKVPDNAVGQCFVFSQNCSPLFCCGGSACETLQYRSNCHRSPHLERMCIVHSTKIRGHPEGESALGASVACWKAACWRQAKGWYIILVKWNLYNEGVLISVYAFESPDWEVRPQGLEWKVSHNYHLNVGPQELTSRMGSPGLEEEVGGRPKGQRWRGEERSRQCRWPYHDPYAKHFRCNQSFAILPAQLLSFLFWLL